MGSHSRLVRIAGLYAMRKVMTLRGMESRKCGGGGGMDGDGIRRGKEIGAIPMAGTEAGMSVGLASRMVLHKEEVSSKSAPKSLGTWSKVNPALPTKQVS